MIRFTVRAKNLQNGKVLIRHFFVQKDAEAHFNKLFNASYPAPDGKYKLLKYSVKMTIAAYPLPRKIKFRK